MRSSRQSPGERAGLKPGDIITSVNGHNIDHSYDLPAVISELTAGYRGEASGLWHDRKATEVKVKTVLLEDSPAEVAKTWRARICGGRARPWRCDRSSRTSSRNCTPRAAWSSKTSPVRHSRQACRQGDVVLGVNGAGVSTVADLKREVSRAGHNVALLIQREEAQIYIPVDLG